MSLGYRERRQLRGIEAVLFRSDSPLVAMLGEFGRLYRGQDMPASERMRSWRDHDWRAIIWIMVACGAIALAIGVVFSAGSRPGHPGTPGSSATNRPVSPDRLAAASQQPRPRPQPRLDHHGIQGGRG